MHMPELPEVETLRRQLQAIVGEELLESVVLDSKLEGIGVSGAARKVAEVVRHGKWLSVVLTGGDEIRFHLRMTGRLLHSTETVSRPHVRFMLRFRKSRLYLIDPRRFATVTLEEAGSGLLPGRDALQACSAEFLETAARSRKVSVKTFLMDQKAIAGIGNIYACEILHAAGIHPERATSKISRTEWKRISAVTPSILKAAIACRGTSVSDWRDLSGKKGEYQKRLRVYKREGGSCTRCGGTIRRTRQGGRSTFHCPDCQK